MVSVQVSIDLPIFQSRRKQPDIASKLALVEQARAIEEDAIRQHVAEARAALADWDAATDRLKRFDDSLLPLARERAKTALAAYRGGRGDLAAVLRRAAKSSISSCNNCSSPRSKRSPMLSCFTSCTRRPSNETLRFGLAVCRCRTCGCRHRWRLLARHGCETSHRFGRPEQLPAPLPQRPPSSDRKSRSEDRSQSAVLARSDGARSEVRQAGQVALHGYAARARVYADEAADQGKVSDQPAHAPEPGHTHRRSQAGHTGHGLLNRRCRERRRAQHHRGAVARQRLRREAVRPGAVRRGGARPAARGDLRARLAFARRRSTSRSSAARSPERDPRPGRARATDAARHLRATRFAPSSATARRTRASPCMRPKRTWCGSSAHATAWRSALA